MATANPGNTPRDRTNSDKHPAQWLALVIGVVYILVGILGFFVTGFDGFAEPDGELLLGIFEVNPLHNIVHLLIGAAGVALWNTLPRARLYGWLLAIGYGATFVFGLFVASSDEPANFLALNVADNWLHLLSALAGLAIALWPADDRGATDRTTTDRTTNTRGSANRGPSSTTRSSGTDPRTHTDPGAGSPVDGNPDDRPR